MRKTYTRRHIKTEGKIGRKNICRIIKDEPSKLLFFLIKPQIVTWSKICEKMIDWCNGKFVNVTHDIAIGVGNESLDISITFPVISDNLINNARNVRSALWMKNKPVYVTAHQILGPLDDGISPARKCMSYGFIGIVRAYIARKTRPVMCARS